MSRTSRYIADWVTAVPATPDDIAAGNEFALAVLRVENPDTTAKYAAVFGSSLMSSDGANETHSTAIVRATEAMRKTALQLLSTGAYPTLLFRVVPDDGVMREDYYVSDIDAAFASLGLSELPSGDEGLVL